MKRKGFANTTDGSEDCEYSRTVLAGDGPALTGQIEHYSEQTVGIREKFAGRAIQHLRVLHVVNRFGTGGTEYGILKVIRGLSAPQFEHCICTTRGYEQDMVEREKMRDRLIVASDKEHGSQFLVPHLVRIIRNYRPHIVHSRNWGAIEAIVAARLARVPVAIHSEHGYEIDMLNGLSFKKRWIRRAIYAISDCVFTVSEQLREYHALQAGINPRRIRVIPNGVDTAKFTPRPEKRNELRRKLGLPADRLVLGSVGRLVAIKGQNLLLDAAELLIKRQANIHVVLAGSGPELNNLSRRVEGSPELQGRVLLLGGSDEIPSVLNAMDVFVLPSLSEGMSNTLLEAMASGLPVVATRTGGNPELVEDGQTGLLFAIGQVNALAECLDQLLTNPQLKRQFGIASRRSALDRFSLLKMIATYQDLYLSLARSQRGVRNPTYPCAA